MKQWLIRKIIAFMGNTYVWLDKKLDHPTGPILGLEIDDDFAGMSRYELCNSLICLLAQSLNLSTISGIFLFMV